MFEISCFVRGDLKSVHSPVKVSKEDFLNLKSNELLTVPSHYLDDVLSELNSAHINKYPTYRTCERAVAKFLNVEVENIQLTAGSDDAIRCLFGGAFLRSTDAIIQWPNYEPYLRYSTLGRINLKKHNIDFKYGHSVDGLIRSVKESLAKVLIVANPNGFTGQSYSVDQVEKILEELNELGTLLILDEAYVGVEVDSLSFLTKKYDNLICIHSFSKELGLAGLRIGAIIGNKKWISLLKPWFQETSLSNLSLSILNKLLSNDEYIPKVKQDHLSAKKSLLNSFDKLPVNVYDTKTNFVLLDLEDITFPSALSTHLKKNWVYPADISGIEGFESCLRLTVCSERFHERLYNLLSEFFCEE